MRSAAEVAKRDRAGDLALLKVNRHPNPDAPVARIADVNRGRAKFNSWRTGYVRTANLQSGDGMWNCAGGACGGPGDSGSPVYTRDGIISVVSGGPGAGGSWLQGARFPRLRKFMEGVHLMLHPGQAQSRLANVERAVNNRPIPIQRPATPVPTRDPRIDDIEKQLREIRKLLSEKPPLQVPGPMLRGEQGETGPQGPEGPTGPQGNAATITSEQQSQISAEVAKRLKADEEFQRASKGEKGDPGEAKALDDKELAARLAPHLPPFTVRTVNNGVLSKKTATVGLGGTLTIHYPPRKAD